MTQQTFWSSLATYCNHLTPVVVPLLEATSQTASALHNAECETRDLQQQIAYFESLQRRNALPEGDD